jgi:hypothetical protein
MALDPLTAKPAAVLESSFCGELRSKKYFLVDGMATQLDDYIDATGHCWCFVTQQVVGPDGNKVNPNRCVPGRACYKSAFADKI